MSQNVCLIVIDGWGLLDEKEGNAIANAETPVMDKLCAENSVGIEAHGLHVGVPEGQMGNSEVGHLNIGAGRDIVRINEVVKNNTLVENEELVNACNRAKKENGRIHLLGLVSDGGVHSHIDHLFAITKAIKALNAPNVFIHFFSDGRDTIPTSGITFVEQVVKFCEEESYGELATIVGRYYAMDRDKRWERIRVAYDALIAGYGQKSNGNDERIIPATASQIIQSRYDEKETDEFMKPIIVSDDGHNDTLIFFNYRSDRMREITETLGMERYKDLGTDVKHPSNLHVVSLTQYNASFPFPVMFPIVKHKNVLAEWLSTHNVKQFHCAGPIIFNIIMVLETEKYAHVTFFFNGGREEHYEGEERCLVPSPKVTTYDLKPEMSAEGVADKMIEKINAKTHPFVMCNFAPPDMVGHTGVYEAAVKACAATDVQIGRIYEACKANNYILLVTADHGNAEKMFDENGGKFTAHTCYKVPLTCSSNQYSFKEPFGRSAALRDVAPTCLNIMGLDIPKEMDGVSLVEKK